MKKILTAPKIKKRMIWVFLAVLLVSQVFISLQISSSGTQLAAFEKEAEDLFFENRKLQDLLITSTSLSGVREKAEQLEFSKPANIIYISPEDTVARLP